MDGVLSQEEINALLNQSNAVCDVSAAADALASDAPVNILSDV